MFYEYIVVIIAAVAHILMAPAIVLECWLFLIISIFVATLCSYISAKFVNKVNSKIVSYVTGYLLLILGIVLVILNYVPIF